MKLNTLYRGDCLDILKTLPENSVDSIITDPPYELGFMGKSWDSTGIANNVELWKECLRVLKPGGHLLAFSGTRTYHRMASAIEDAGFEVRDMIEWVYGCLSEDTEILTANGWKMLYSVFEGDYVFACDYKNDMKLQLEQVKQKFIYDYDEDAYHIKDTGYYNSELMETDHIVSKNHNVLVLESWVRNAGFGNNLYWEKIPAEKLYENIQKIGGKKTFRIPGLNGDIPCTIKKIPYKGKVWCVEVESGAFVARRNGKIFITGNSGFPKSLNIGKAVDKLQGRSREDEIEFANHIKEIREKSNKTSDEWNKEFGYVAGCKWWETLRDNGYRPPNREDYEVLKTKYGASEKFQFIVDRWYPIGEKTGTMIRSTAGFSNEQVPRPWKEKVGEEIDTNALATEEAKQWEGWGTALKPAHEPIVWATKSLTNKNQFAIMEDINSNLISTIWQSLENLQKQDTFKLQETVLIHLNTALLWQNILVELLKNESKFTTSTASKMITELKILNSLLLKNTQDDTDGKSQTYQNGTQESQANGLDLLVGIVESCLAGEKKSIANIQTLIVQGLATYKQNRTGMTVKNVEQDLLPIILNANSVLISVLTDIITELSQNELSTFVSFAEKSLKQYLAEPQSIADENVWQEHIQKALPNHSPICMARKPLAEKTVAENCLKWGTGGINIDESRVETSDMEELEKARCNFEKNQTHKMTNTGQNFLASKELKATHNVGRFPANLIWSCNEDEYEYNGNEENLLEIIKMLGEKTT